MKESVATLLRVKHLLLVKLHEQINKNSVKHYIVYDKNTEHKV